MKTVAIVGTQPETRANAPFDDPKIDIWVFNEAAAAPWCPRATAVFQMHLPAIYRSPHNRNDAQHWEWLQARHGYPIYMLARDEAVPDSVAYPLESLLRKLQAERHFTSSVAYALALAAFYDYERVQLYGIEMSSNTEYHYQRQCVLYWLGVLAGRGVQVERYCANGLFSAWLYGYDGGLAQDVEQLAARQVELEQQRAGAQQARQQVESELDAALFQGQAESAAGLLTQLGQVADLSGRADGALAELMRYHYMAADNLAKFGRAYLDRNELEAAAGKQREKLDALGGQVYFTAGRLDYVFGAWKAGHDPRALAQVRQLARAHAEAAYQSGYAWGIYDENSRLASELDDRRRAAGGEKAQAILEKN